MYKDIFSAKLGRFVYSLDDEDERRVDQYQWYITRNLQIIAVVNGILSSLPRFLLSYTGKKFIDHIDCNPLNNSKPNFRLSSPMQNLQNRRKFSTYRQRVTTSQYKGVTFEWSVLRWKAQIGFEGGVIYLGHFDSELEAAIAYNNAATYCFQEFARLNPIPVTPIDDLYVPMTLDNLIRLIQSVENRNVAPIIDLFVESNPLFSNVGIPDFQFPNALKMGTLIMVPLSIQHKQVPPSWCRNIYQVSTTRNLILPNIKGFIM